MSAGTVLTIIGGGLELCGLGIAACGIRKTRLEYARHLLGVGGTLKAVTAQLLRFGDEPPTAGRIDATLPVIDTAMTAENGFVKIKFEEDSTPLTRETQLLERVNFLGEWLAEIGASVKVEASAREAAVRAARETMDQELAQLHKDIDRAVAGDLPRETLGLFLAAVGAALQLAGAAV